MGSYNDYFTINDASNIINYYEDISSGVVSFQLLNEGTITFKEDDISLNFTIVGGGGGGGGGGHDNGNSDNPYPKYPSGGGGGAGGAGRYYISTLSGESITYSIGAGGSSGSGNNSGQPGKNTTIECSGNKITATGGAYGRGHYDGNGSSDGGEIDVSGIRFKMDLEVTSGGGGRGVNIVNIGSPNYNGMPGTANNPSTIDIYPNNSILIGGGGGGANAMDKNIPTTNAGKGGKGGNGNGGALGEGNYTVGTTDYYGESGIAPGSGGGGGGQPGPPATNPSKWTDPITKGGSGAAGAIYVWFNIKEATQYYKIYYIPQYTSSFTIFPIITDSSTVTITPPHTYFSLDNTSKNIIYTGPQLTNIDTSYVVHLNVNNTGPETIKIEIAHANIYDEYNFPEYTGFDIILQQNLPITDVSLTISTTFKDIRINNHHIIYDISYGSTTPDIGNYSITSHITTDKKVLLTQDISINITNKLYDISYDIHAYSQFKITPLTPIISPVSPYDSSNISVTSLYYDISGNYYKDSFYFSSDNSGVIQEYYYPPVGKQYVYQRIIDSEVCMWYQIVELNFKRYYNDSYEYNAHDTIDIVPINLPITSDVTVSSYNIPHFVTIESTGRIKDISPLIVNTFNYNVVFENSANKLYWNKEHELTIMSSGCLWNPDLSGQTDIWSRFSGDCIDLSGAILTPGVPMTYDDLSEKRKAVIFQYKNNSAGFSKKQQFSRLARGLGKQGKQTYATQNDNYINPNNKGLKLNNFTLECPGAIKNSGFTNENDTPGPVRTITNYPNVPLTNYIVQRTYRGGSEKWPQYGPNTGQPRNPKLSRNTGTKPGYTS